MKKGLILTVLLCSLLTFGCGKSAEEKKADLDEKLKEYGRNWYETYVKDQVDGLDVPIADATTFEQVNAQEEAQGNEAPYDLSIFEKCNDDYTVTINLKEDKRTIDSIDVDLKCEE